MTSYQKIIRAIIPMPMPKSMRRFLIGLTGSTPPPSTVVSEGFKTYAERLLIGKNVFINRNVMICANINQPSMVIIDDNVFIGPNVTICCVSHQIGDYEKRAGDSFNKNVIIGKGCWIGANVVILPGVTIGSGTIVGAGSVVIKSLEKNSLYVGNPCRKIRELI